MLSWVPYIVVTCLWASIITAMEGTPQEAPETDPAPVLLPVQRTGDEITLKSGKVLHGVKIIRETSTHLVLETIPGLEPLLIPTTQVVSIKLGTRARRRSEPPPVPPVTEEPKPSTLAAVKTSPELITKMAAPFTSKPIYFERQDILNTIRSIAIMSGVSVVFSPQIERVPDEERLLTFAVDADTSFDQFLKETLSKGAPWLTITFEYDRLHFDVRTNPSIRGPAIRAPVTPQREGDAEPPEHRQP